MRDYVLLFVNGRRHEIRGQAAFLPLSDYLRYQQRLTGTKIVCSEGDCGACAVLVGTPAPAIAATEERLNYRAITSCIAPIFQLDGTHIITVEGLAKAAKQQGAGAIHPVQKAMVACNGAQCGFCTPGFVVSMAGMCEERVARNERELREGDIRFGLTGNLCRCTGYEQILNAGKSVDCDDVLSLNEVYPVGGGAGGMIAEIRNASATAVRVEDGGKFFYKPTEMADACRFKRDNAGCVIVAGATDIGVLINKGRIEPKILMSVWGLRGIAGIEDAGTHLAVGAGATLSALESATKTAMPELHQIMRRHGSPLIRNAGTLAGNIVNGSPIGDTMPALMVLEAEVELTGINGSRRVSMNAFYTGYRKTVIASDELMTRIFIPKIAQGELLRLYKVSKRWDLDISTFTAAIWIKAAASNSNGNGNGHAGSITIQEARVAYGGVGPVILRLPKTESFLKGKVFGEEVMEHAGLIAREEITPISDVRSSADYRWQLAENIPLKLYHELQNSAELSA